MTRLSIPFIFSGASPLLILLLEATLPRRPPLYEYWPVFRGVSEAVSLPRAKERALDFALDR